MSIFNEIHIYFSSSRITDDLIVCYEKKGKADGQACLLSRVKKQKIALYSISEKKFVTIPSESIKQLAKEFSKYTPFSESQIAEQLKKERDFDKNIVQNSRAIPWLD